MSVLPLIFVCVAFDLGMQFLRCKFFSFFFYINFCNQLFCVWNSCDQCRIYVCDFSDSCLQGFFASSAMGKILEVYVKTILLECSKEFFGASCKNKCLCVAGKTTACHHVTGACTCAPGYTGSTCAASKKIYYEMPSVF